MSGLIAHWRGRPTPKYRRVIVRRALYTFLRFLIREGVPVTFKPSTTRELRLHADQEAVLSEYRKFLLDHKGLAPKTTERYVHQAIRVCSRLKASRNKTWDELTPAFFVSYVHSLAGTHSHMAMQATQTELRSFLRFLLLTKRIQIPVERFFVRVRRYKYQNVPAATDPEDLRRLFEDTEGSKPQDIRDRAVLMLLTLYGLRIGEVARLTFDDVQWRYRQLAIRCRKNGRDLMLPLHTAVAQALFRYVSEARPRDTLHREIFIRAGEPRPYVNGSQLGAALGWRARRLGLRFHPHGLRHLLARQLINNDCPPEWIQILLGHKRFSSTMLYSKVDLKHLREVAESDVLPL
jgi:site-specific recombinase XerD